MSYVFRIAAFTLLSLAWSSLAFAQGSQDVEYTYKKISDWHLEVDKLAESTSSVPKDGFENFRSRSAKALRKHERQAESCRKFLTDSIENIDIELSVIGESPQQDVNFVAIARRSLNKERLTNQRKLTSCKLLVVKTEKIRKQLNELTLEKQTEERLYQSHSLVEIGKKLGDLELFTAFKQIARSIIYHETSFSFIFWFLGWGGLILLIPFQVQAYRKRTVLFDRITTHHLIGRLALAFFFNNHVLLFLLGIISYALGLVLIWHLLTGADTPALSFLLILETWLLALCATNTAFSTHEKIAPLLSFFGDSNRVVRRHTRFLITYFFIGYILGASSFETHINQVSIDLSRFIFLSLYTYSLSRILWHFSCETPIKIFRPFKYLVPIAGALSFIILSFGYYNFFHIVVHSVTVSYFIIYGGFLLHKLFTDLLDSFDEGRYHWQKNLKHTLDVKTDDIMPGVIWLRIIQVVVLLAIITTFLLNEWEISSTSTQDIFSYISEGFVIGKISIVPMQIFQSLLFIALSMSILMWAKKQFELRVLSKSRMDVGARDALGSILMYSLGFLLILIAVSIAGVNFSNIAIVAGALSVGIGFGLQAIVNNFVSGLILLLERPIQKGDWVVVDKTEGYVKRISVRSTLIETFDKADVIVPNSDLITHVVKNWTLKDSRGRVCINVGISYDSDVDKAREILMDIAKNRPETISGYDVPVPQVLLIEFGNSSVDLQLRFFVAHINSNLSISSEVRFEILRRFKEENIEIPFPQRVLHINKTIEE